MIYIVDDDVAVRESLCALLETHGFELSLHPSGNDFLERYDRGPPACVLLDIHMPGISGTDVLRRLRAAGQFVPVVAITGRGDPALKNTLLQSGASSVLDKPVDEDELLEAIEAAFAS